MVTKKKKLIIFDGNAIIHRSFHAIPPLTIKSGEMVNAVYGFTSMLLKVFKDLKPDYIAVTFDMFGPTFRHEKFKEYKAKRVKAPQELYDQIGRVHELVEAFSIPIYEQKGFEADDVIGTITKEAKEVEKIIVTGDMDTMQLVDEDTKVYTLKKGLSDTVIYDEAAVKERYGLRPDQMIDYKALRGDPSDNIPGVKGIGEKTAVELLQKFVTLDKIYQALEQDDKSMADVKDRVKELLKKHKQDAQMSKKLATIVCDVPIDFDLAETSVKHYDRDKVVKLFQQLEFKTLLNRLPDVEKGEDIKMVERLRGREIEKSRGQDNKYILVDKETKLNKLIEELRKQKHLCVDTETTGLDERTAKLLGISFSWEKGQAYYVNVENRPEWVKKLKPVLESPQIDKYGHNLKYDWQILKRYGVDLAPLYFDSMIAAYLLSSGRRTYKLEDLVFSELGYEMQPIQDLIGPKGKKQIAMTEVPVDKLSWYSCEDADYALQLSEKLDYELEKQDIHGLMQKIEMPLVKVLGQMELAGIRIDRSFLKSMSVKLNKRLEIIKGKIHKEAGGEFNIASPLQLKEVLFDKLEISTEGLGRTKTGVSSAASELEKLEKKHPIIPMIMEWRELAKLINTYIDALPKLVNTVTGRVHTNFNQTITSTGRLSSSDPNLQNIPIRTDMGKEIRKAFIADRGNKLIAADYSQIELRIIASLANDEKMLDAFNKGEDIHQRTAADINEVAIDKVTPEMRYAAKEINFGIIYGMGVYGLASRTGIDRDEAREFIRRYYESYEAIAHWLEETRRLAHENEYVETLFGRRRYLPELQSHNHMLKAQAERMAVNMPIQGTAADLIKLAMIAIADGLPKVSAEAKMLLQVHDELVFEVPNKEVDKVADYIKKTMENVYKLRAPIDTHIGVGDNWGECK
ncbi:MAG: DNA polymerase I [Patescibacteria group bacterium]